MTTTTLAVPQCLYRFYDAADRLLYIGITSALGSRWDAHNRHKTWWPDVVRATVEHHPDRAAVLAAEKAAINAEKPIHNVTHNTRRGRTATSPFMSTPPAGAKPWNFSNHYGDRENTPLWLYWEVDGDPCSDNYSPDEVDAVELWNEWRRDYPPDPNEFFGPTAVRIWWFVEGPGILEAAPAQDSRGIDWMPQRHFLGSYTWPVDPKTGHPLQWMRLPVVDKVWRTGPIPKGAHTKGGFIQEATGWKPAPFQPFMDVAQVEALSRL
jgi:predicted GIY-YIG superfamily endonuclease